METENRKRMRLAENFKDCVQKIKNINFSLWSITNLIDLGQLRNRKSLDNAEMGPNRKMKKVVVPVVPELSNLGLHK